MTTQRWAQRCAACIHERFRDYEDRFRRITSRAPERFMNRQWTQVQAETTERLNLYAAIVDQTETGIRRLLENRVADGRVWAAARADYAARIAGGDNRELAETFFNSVTRRIFGTVGVNRQIEFVHDDDGPVRPGPSESLCRVYPLADPIEPAIRRMLSDFNEVRIAPAVMEKVMPRIAERVEKQLGHSRPARIEMIRHIFFRGQGAYLIGRIVAGSRVIPLALALLHEPAGVRVDALVLDTDGLSIVFSYTRSAFHVAMENPGELVGFLKSIMPSKPEAELYSAVGYFKHGKTVLYRDVCRHTAQCTQDRFRLSAGKRGMVMVVFDMAGHDMVVKLIRDRFDSPKRTTRNKVMTQYAFVFNHYRVGRLIEAHTFEHLSFDRCWFSDDLLDHLTTEAGQTVRLENDRVIIDHAYLERRVTPLDIYLKEASAEKTDAAVVDFGNAIKDLAFANIFPGDMLLKNFGVTRHGRVVFYDYDEIVPLVECRFRTIPRARTDMEEMADEPWYTVGENDVFPEEFSRFLGLSPEHRDLFLSRHADLLATDFWTAVQDEIRSGHIRHIRPYALRYRLEQE
ncbi:isocitrate dehydrogenase kinase/phosphatase [Desulfosarcina alkanivorans]|uniref:Isocitrate dehydrogenase kinase/phosphatase n=1 Tax=Desulfosarcina alkanivorans TaxID=571177 RepID=A0A5K7YHH0_9BACT|nr:bifunctional isocitrate dehydrogenase kinase/phosphatase [Desulfosarcina alkanivorans]BBO67835.1 isocitrate dehydrogenase kinase/phosphatase [Desulfosarcina alkanivorans]